MNHWQLSPRSKVISFTVVLILAVIATSAITSLLTSKANAGSLGAHKVKLPRDDVYYDIVNDAGDQGNFILQFHVPDADQPGKKVYCIAYKDHSKTAGGVSLSCDWDHVS